MQNPAAFRARNPVPVANNVNRFNNQIKPINTNAQNNNLADWNFMLSQYKIFCSHSTENEVDDALCSSDFRVKFAAILVAGEKNLNVNDKLFDLLYDENKFIQQASRKALMVKSYFLIKEIKEYNFTSTQKIKTKTVNPNTLKVGIDYVDFGPLPQDENNLTNHAITRWKSWYSLKEGALRDLNNKKKELTEISKNN